MNASARPSAEPAAPPRPPAGVYLHWPFCERKCPYCDFYTFGREHPLSKQQGAYLAALLEEIATAPERFGWSVPPALDTIYLGGGTPSLMGPDALASILNELKKIFVVSASAEITLEVNPTTAEAAQLDRALALGVNRLSVGCQSFSDRVLGKLGRVHDAATTRQAIKMMRELGVANLSLDLIFGAPTQTIEDFENDIREILTFQPEHISAYNMTVHEGTPFARWQREGRLGLPEEDDQVAMFELLMDRMDAAGYEHYEISNWSRVDQAIPIQPNVDPLAQHRRDDSPTLDPLAQSRKDDSPTLDPLMQSRRDDSPTLDPLMQSRRDDSPTLDPLAQSRRDDSLSAQPFKAGERAPQEPPSPVGTTENSPPFQGWDPGDQKPSGVPEGRQNRRGGPGHHSSPWYSRHNTKYWRDCDVYGFGVAAHGVERGRRFANPADLRAYLDPARRELAEPLPPPVNERARSGEVMMLALRRTLGVGWDEINAWLGRDARACYAAELAQLHEEGLIEPYAQTLRLTRRGILVSDSVMETFF